MLIYIQEVIWIEDQGGRAHPYAVHYTSHISELPLAFHYDWENENILPDALRHFKRYQTCMVTFCTYYIAWIFQWILGDEGRGNGDCTRSIVRAVSTGCEPPSVLRPGCCCYMQEIAPVDYWHQAHSSSLGGPRHSGTGLTLWCKADFSIITPVFSVTWSF